MTYGSALLNGYDVYSQINQVRQFIGYCPQYDGLLRKWLPCTIELLILFKALMTGREHLYMYGRLRGIPSQDLDRVVDDLIERLGLIEHAERQAGTYSGGNKRKLSTAIALIGDPPIVFLDEPV